MAARAHASYETYGSGLSYNSVTSNAGQPKTIDLKEKTAIRKILFVSGFILLIIGLIIMMLVTSSRNETIAPEEISEDDPTSSLLDEIRADYPWTNSDCGSRSRVTKSAKGSDPFVEKNHPKAELGQYPWILAVVNFEKKFFWLPPSPEFSCLTTLIAPSWTLTSADRCSKIIPTENSNHSNPESFTAIVVTKGYRIPKEIPLFDHKIYHRLARYCHTHPGWLKSSPSAGESAVAEEIDRPAVENNIALIRLDKLFQHTTLIDSGTRTLIVAEICLPPISSISSSIQRRAAQKFYEFAHHDPGLNPMIDEWQGDGSILGRKLFNRQSVCESKHEKLLISFCRQPNSNEPGLCSGDSGGPLVQKYLDIHKKERYILHGIATTAESAEALEETNCQEFSKSSFINVAAHGHWINETIYQNGGPKIYE